MGEPISGAGGAALGEPLDQIQLDRIEGVHRGFLYQHLFAVGCLMRMAVSGADAVVVERDEDVEVVLPERRVYVQVKTRSRALQWNDLSAAIERFVTLRDEHLQGRRHGSPWFVVASNTAPGADLLARIELPSWPKDIAVRWPESARSEADTALPAEAGTALPPPWADILAALRWCKTAAGEIAFTALPAETLVWKLAALAAYAATGGRDHRFEAAVLPALFEQLVVQLQDFPEPPARYRPQENEPNLETDDRVRILVGFSGAGKTAWASQAALHSPSPVAYFDVGDLPGSAVANSLARELAARFLGGRAGGLGGGLLAAQSGLELLRALDLRLAAEGVAVTVVLDNAHRLAAADLRSVVEAASGVRFVIVAQPWPGQALIEAQLGLRAETLQGWSLDAVVAEFAAADSRMDAATGLRVRGSRPACRSMCRTRRG
jgi:hypothetical protein